MRQLARALTGFANDWTDAGPTRFRYERKLHDAKPKRIYGKRGKFTWQEGVQARHAPPPPPRVHGHEAVGLLHPDRAVAGDASRRSRGCTWPSPARGAPGGGGDPRAPRPLRRRPADGQAACRAGRGHAARASGAAIDTADWAWLCDGAGQYLFMPPNVSGWDDTRWLDTATFRARWMMAQYICEPAAARSRQGHRAVRPGRARARRPPPSGARPRSPARSAPASSATPPTRSPTADGGLEARRLPRARAERAAHARRHLPRLPHLMSSTCCTEHARASAGLPAIEPGMPEPAGTGLSRRSLLLRAAGLGLAVYGAGKLAQLPRSRRASRRRRPPGRAPCC